PRQRPLPEEGLSWGDPGLSRRLAPVAGRSRRAPQSRAGPARAEGAEGAAEEATAAAESGPEGPEEAGPTTTAEAGRPEEGPEPGRAAEERRAARGGALPERGRHAQGAGDAAPRRAAAEREGRAEEAAAGAARAEEGREGLVRGLRSRSIATALPVVLALAAL